MPVRRCKSNGKWRIGSGPCIYKSKASADRAYAGYKGKVASGHRGSKGKKRKRRKR